MIHKVGLLPMGNNHMVPSAYNMYMRDNPEGWKEANRFKRIFCSNVEVEILGLWSVLISTPGPPSSSKKYSSFFYLVILSAQLD